MPKTCIFCSALYKKKKDSTKEKTIKCRDLDAPASINNAQEEKQSEFIAHVLKNYDLLANEAHYRHHRSDRLRPRQPTTFTANILLKSTKILIKSEAF